MSSVARRLGVVEGRYALIGDDDSNSYRAI